ncbi:MAG: hypothetical protein ACOCUZ_02355 [bacterium]
MTEARKEGCRRRALRPRLLLVAAFLAVLPVSLAAQSDGTGGSPEGGPVLLQLPHSARSAALAGAAALAAPDADLLFVNPALLANAGDVGVTAQRYGRDGRLASMAAATEWWGGGAGLGLRLAEYRTPLDGPQRLRRRAGDRLHFRGADDAPTEPVAERAVTAGYARTVLGFRVGASLSALELRRSQDSDATGVLDLGIARSLGPVTVGLSGGGLGPSLDGMPPGFRRLAKWTTAGLGTRTRAVGPLDLSAAAAVTLREGGRLEGGGGLEVAWWPVQGRTFVGRVGFGGPEIDDASRLSLGGGFLGDSFALEYAWRDLGGGPGMHAVSVRFR